VAHWASARCRSWTMGRGVGCLCLIDARLDAADDRVTGQRTDSGRYNEPGSVAATGTTILKANPI
jgi:hypothetical protein